MYMSLEKVITTTGIRCFPVLNTEKEHCWYPTYLTRHGVKSLKFCILLNKLCPLWTPQNRVRFHSGGSPREDVRFTCRKVPPVSTLCVLVHVRFLICVLCFLRDFIDINFTSFSMFFLHFGVRSFPSKLHSWFD